MAEGRSEGGGEDGAAGNNISRGGGEAEAAELDVSGEAGVDGLWLSTVTGKVKMLDLGIEGE